LQEQYIKWYSARAHVKSKHKIKIRQVQSKMTERPSMLVTTKSCMTVNTKRN